MRDRLVQWIYDLRYAFLGLVLAVIGFYSYTFFTQRQSYSVDKERAEIFFNFIESTTKNEDATIESFIEQKTDIYSLLIEVNQVIQNVKVDKQIALNSFDKLALKYQKISEPIANFLSLRALLLALDVETPDQIKKRIYQFNSSSNNYYSFVKEIDILLSIREKNYAEAIDKCKQFITEFGAKKVSQTKRVETYLTLLPLN